MTALSDPVAGLRAARRSLTNALIEVATTAAAERPAAQSSPHDASISALADLIG